jgi:DNA polymerase-3 subunit epsilon
MSHASKSVMKYMTFLILITLFYCTLQASRRYFPKLENHQLHTVSAHVGYILDNHHHALADAEACAEIALKLQML